MTLGQVTIYAFAFGFYATIGAGLASAILGYLFLILS